MARRSIKPWLDYFEMLISYENKGLIDILEDKHEGYITQPVLCAITPGENPKEQVERGDTLQTAVRIRAYAAWKTREGEDYIEEPFALHVVKTEKPHDPVCTILLTRRRPWWRPWRKSDHVEVIVYGK